MANQVRIIVGGPNSIQIASSLLLGERNGPRNNRQQGLDFRVKDAANSWNEEIMIDSVERINGDPAALRITGFNTANSSRVEIVYGLIDRGGTMVFLKKTE